MAVRSYQFVVGAETPTLPTAGTPSGSSDTITLGYANDHYVQGGAPVADITALKAIGSSDRADNDALWVDAENAFFVFDSASSTTGDDLTVVQPSSGTGRWFRASRNPVIGSTASFRNQAVARFYEQTANGSNYVGLTAPNSVSADLTFKLPGADGTSGQALVTDASGNLSFASVAAAVNYLYSAKSADYTITTSDNIRVLAMTTGGTDRTITLPSAASSVDRIITIKKVDGLDSDGTGKLTIARAGSDTIGGATSQLLFSANDVIEIISNGSDWNIIRMRQFEYAYNTDTSSGNDTTNFAYGPGGVLVPNRSTGTASIKRIGWLSPAIQGDQIFGEMNQAVTSTIWFPTAQMWPSTIQTAKKFGLELVDISSSAVSLSFSDGGYRSTSGAYGSNGDAWGDLFLAGYKWRMVKIRII